MPESLPSHTVSRAVKVNTLRQSSSSPSSSNSMANAPGPALTTRARMRSFVSTIQLLTWPEFLLSIRLPWPSGSTV